MRYFSRISIAIVALGFFFVPTVWLAELNHSPIVQIMSYKTSFDRNTQLLWWGSASIINDKWIILTNNHVVDDGKGNPLEIFSICVTTQDGEKAKCPYTASLIERNELMDIAILKIDETDINGQKVDFSQFKSIEVDYAYEPKTGDEVEAVGYPWVGSDTITKTKWIVSGTAKNNDITYIKTDTLIAGGNSGGALIKDWKLIWIPTFTKWWMFDSNLSYALSIKEAQKFVEANIAIIPKKSATTQFATYKKTLNKINESRTINDNFINIGFPKEYEVINYIADKKISFAPVWNTETIPQSIELYLQDIPHFKSQDEYFYYLETLGLYSKNYQKLKKISISGIDFYEAVSIYDSSDGGINTYKTFFGKVGNHLIVIYGDLGYVSESTIAGVNTKFESFIKDIKFKKETLGNVIHDFELVNPEIQFYFDDAYFYDDVEGLFRLYLNDNLHEYIEVAVMPFDIFSGKWQTIDKIYEQETNDINNDLKSLISLNGHRGFIYCTEDNPYGYMSYDEKGNTLNQSSCRAKVFDIWGGKNTYYLDIALITDKQNIKSGNETLAKHLPKLIKLPSTSDGITNVPNVFKSQIKLEFGDIKNQSEGFKTKLKLLVKYGLIKNEKLFWGNKPMLWGEFVDLYMRGIYGVNLESKKCKETEYACRFSNLQININGKKKTLTQVLDMMEIKPEYYVNKDKVIYFQNYLSLILAWAEDIENIDEETLDTFNILFDEDSQSEWRKKVEAFNYAIYGNKKIFYTDIYPSIRNDSFIANKIIYFVRGKWLVDQKLYLDGKINFTRSPTPVKLDGIYYPVLLKGQAIDLVMMYMDFGLFDATLARKKQTNIDGE